MEEEQIELWYEEQKQKLSEEYIKEIEKGTPIEKRERRFHKAMDKLSMSYDRRHAKFRAETIARKRRKRLFRLLSKPFTAAREAILFIFRALFGGVSAMMKERYAHLCFSMDMLRIRHSHKIIDGSASMFRPWFYFYVKHLQTPLRILFSPFVAIFRFFRRIVLAIDSAIKSSASAVWKAIKAAAKSLMKRFAAVHKVISAKTEAWSKAHHERQSRRIQAALDRKQARKEAKEKRKKEKEQAKGGKEPKAAGDTGDEEDGKDKEGDWAEEDGKEG